MKEKELIDTFGLKQGEISDLVKYLNEHHIKRSFNLFGELVIDDDIAMQAIPAYISARSEEAGKQSVNERTSSTEEERNAQNQLTFTQQWKQESSYSAGSGQDLPYLVYQVTLKEKFLGTGSGNLTELENVINQFYHKGYRLHTMSTATSDGSKGFGGGDRIQATLVFEKINLFS